MPLSRNVRFEINKCPCDQDVFQQYTCMMYGKVPADMTLSSNARSDSEKGPRGHETIQKCVCIEAHSLEGVSPVF